MFLDIIKLWQSTITTQDDSPPYYWKSFSRTRNWILSYHIRETIFLYQSSLDQVLLCDRQLWTKLNIQLPKYQSHNQFYMYLTRVKCARDTYIWNSIICLFICQLWITIVKNILLCLLFLVYFSLKILLCGNLINEEEDILKVVLYISECIWI